LIQELYNNYDIFASVEANNIEKDKKLDLTYMNSNLWEYFISGVIQLKKLLRNTDEIDRVKIPEIVFPKINDSPYCSRLQSQYHVLSSSNPQQYLVTLGYL
jgi:hypothetical protein